MTTDKDLLLGLHEQGLNNSEIGRRLGISRERVRQLLGAKSRRKPKIDLVDREKIRQCLEDGLNLSQLMKEFNCTSIAAIIDEIEGGRELLERNLTRPKLDRLEAKTDYWKANSPVGRLTIHRVFKKAGSAQLWADCTCECGRKTTPHLRNIREGISLSCGRGGCHMPAHSEAKERAIALGKAEPKFGYPRDNDR